MEPMQETMLRNRDVPGLTSGHSRAAIVAAALVGLAMQGVFVGGLNSAMGNRGAGNLALELSAAAGLAGFLIGAQELSVKKHS